MLSVQKYVAEWAGILKTHELARMSDASKRLRRGVPLDADQALEIAALIEGVVIRVHQPTDDPAQGSKE